MRNRTAALGLVLFLSALPSSSVAADALPAIETVEVGEKREFRVNGQPFFPLMAWLQDAQNFPAAKACGMNTTAGYWPGSSGTKDVAEYQELVAREGLYGVMPFDARLKAHPKLLGYIHDDEPDLPHQVSDAEVVPGAGLAINRSTPLWRIVDGVTHSWSVLDPMQDATLTIRLKQPVTVESLGVYLTISPGLAVAKDVSFEGDGRKLLSATLENKKGPQKLPLSAPATFRELKMTVHATYPGQQEWGSISEIEGFDAAGQNVLLSPPRHEPRAWSDATDKKYQEIKSADPSRPVFMTLTGHFHPQLSKWTDRQRGDLYPAYIRASDVIGYDIYPIYGWNKPEWIHLVYEATGMLAEMSGQRPVYAWIETSKGSQWTGPLERQKDVTPTHIRAEVWMAICQGATAIGYFTHVWKPSYQQFGVPEENRQAIRQINEQITRLTPAILGTRPQREISIQAAGDQKLALMARECQGDLFLFAVNYDERALPAEARISVAGLRAGGSLEVVDENRPIASAAGEFRDSFEPLAVHIYRVKL